MGKTILKNDYVEVRRYQNGLVYATDGKGGVGSPHASIHSTGSVKGMVDKGWWKKEDLIIKGGQHIYNCSQHVYRISNWLDLLAVYFCDCGGWHECVKCGEERSQGLLCGDCDESGEQWCKCLSCGTVLENKYTDLCEECSDMILNMYTRITGASMKNILPLKIIEKAISFVEKNSLITPV